MILCLQTPICFSNSCNFSAKIIDGIDIDEGVDDGEDDVDDNEDVDDEQVLLLLFWFPWDDVVNVTKWKRLNNSNL